MGVILRERKAKDGKASFYLDIHHKGHRWGLSLGIYLIPGESTKRRQAKLKAAVKIQNTVSAVLKSGIFPNNALELMKIISKTNNKK